MLLRVKRIRDYGVFAAFDWPDELPDFARRNLIYGWNYSGKTTLSRIIRSVGLGNAHPNFAAGRFEILTSDGHRITSPDDPPPFPIYVFNSDYVGENLHWEEGVEPILILGARSRALDERRQRLSSMIERLERRRELLKEEKAAISREMDDAATKEAGGIRQTLAVIPFNRTPHLDAVVNVVARDPREYLLSDDEFHEQYSILKAEQRQALSPMPTATQQIDQPSLDALSRATAQQMVIEGLKADRQLESWVEAGLSLHEESDACKFCGGPLPPDLLERLSAHFSGSLKTLKSEIEKAQESLQDCRIDLPLFDEANLYEDLRPKYRDLSKRLRRNADRVNHWIEGLRRELEEKKARVDESYDFQTHYSPRAYVLLAVCIGRINELVDTHNMRVANSGEVKEEAKERLIRHRAAAYMRDTDLNGRRHDLESLEDRLENDDGRRERLSAELRLVDEQISAEVLGADRVNEYLRSFFGKEDIRIEVRPDKKYALKRSGHLATNLSEGERTAISFSYFLAQLDGRDVKLEDSVVYVDDPVSSLDSNHLYNTYAVIKDVLAQAGQLFVSTHDYGFFKLLRGDSCFREFPEKDKRRASLYLVRRQPSSGARLEPLPDLLRLYNSEYHYLFSVMYAFHCNPEADDALPLLLPNLVRRVLETYTSFRVPKTSITLDQRLQRLCKDDVVAHRIYKFVNQRSHSDSLSGAQEFPHVEECAEIVGLVLGMMRADDEHCGGMIELCELHPQPN